MNIDELPALALSIRQPWAWAILTLGKDIENRSWPTNVRGDIALHASAGMTHDEYEDFILTRHDIAETHPFPEGTTVPAFKELQRGGIVGVITIADCVSHSKSPWFFGDYGFVLENARAVDFIPVKGALGFFDWRSRL